MSEIEREQRLEHERKLERTTDGPSKHPTNIIKAIYM